MHRILIPIAIAFVYLLATSQAFAATQQDPAGTAAQAHLLSGYGEDSVEVAMDCGCKAEKCGCESDKCGKKCGCEKQRCSQKTCTKCEKKCGCKKEKCGCEQQCECESKCRPRCLGIQDMAGGGMNRINPDCCMKGCFELLCPCDASCFKLLGRNCREPREPKECRCKKDDCGCCK